MNDLQIKYFLGVVNNGLNFTRASQALYVSQPALSKHIYKLGEELGVRLFDTSKKNYTKLTPAGESFYKFFTEYNDKLSKTIAEARALHDQYAGEIKIACINGWDMSALLQKINIFQNKFPHISISFDSTGFRAIDNGLRNNHYDIIISISTEYEGMPNILSKNLYNIQRILLYSENHILAEKNDLSILDFKDDILYILSSDETPLARIINEAYCKSKGFIPKVKELPNVDSLFMAIGSGKGYTILDKFQFAKTAKIFKYIELDDYINICIFWKKDNANNFLPIFLEHIFGGV
jgi:DNA-binding transcriptional LysR family regulator